MMDIRKKRRTRYPNRPPTTPEVLVIFVFALLASIATIAILISNDRSPSGPLRTETAQESEEDREAREDRARDREREAERRQQAIEERNTPSLSDGDIRDIAFVITMRTSAPGLVNDQTDAEIIRLGKEACAMMDSLQPRSQADIVIAWAAAGGEVSEDAGAVLGTLLGAASVAYCPHWEHLWN